MISEYGLFSTVTAEYGMTLIKQQFYRSLSFAIREHYGMFEYTKDYEILTDKLMWVVAGASNNKGTNKRTKNCTLS